MNHLSLAACTASIVSICGATVAQTYTVSPSATYDKSEGGDLTTTFGSFAGGRFQIADGNPRGNAMSVKSISFRHDHNNYDVTQGMGRTWSSVKIHAAECDLASFGTTFSTNSTTTPTKVFDGSLSWPIQLGVPKTVPADWSLQTPFTSTFSFTGTGDLLTDFEFAGGTLANHQPWSGGAAQHYVLDSFKVGLSSVGPATDFGRINGGCADSGANSPVGASMLMTTVTHGPNATNPALRNRYTAEASGTNFAPNTATMVVLAFGAEKVGVPLPGVTCNNIHLTLAKLWFFHPLMTDAVGNIAPYSFGYPNGGPYTPAYHGINIVTQAAWTDTLNANLLFSSLSQNSFVTLPFDTANDVKMKAAYGPDSTAATAPFSSSGVSDDIPLMRYEN